MMTLSKGFLKSYLALVVFNTLFLMSLYASAEMRPASTYTDLTGGTCKTIKEDRVTGSSVRKCPGVGGFYLLVADDDARMSVSVVTPENKEYPLEYWSLITRSFSTLGTKAEWRVVNDNGTIRPIALIVRVDAYEQEDLTSPKKKSYLAIAKIGDEEICVVGKIKPAKDANEQARRAADKATGQPCLKP